VTDAMPAIDDDVRLAGSTDGIGYRIEESLAAAIDGVRRHVYRPYEPAHGNSPRAVPADCVSSIRILSVADWTISNRHAPTSCIAIFAGRK